MPSEPKNMAVMKRPIGIIALSLAAGGLSGCGGGEEAPEAKARDPSPESRHIDGSDIALRT
jgi:hypothetical protein